MYKPNKISRKSLLLLLFVLLSGSSSFGQVNTLYELYRRKDFPALSQVLQDSRQLDNRTRKVYQATVFNAYGKAEKSNQLLQSRRISPSELLAADTLAYIALRTAYDNNLKLHHYQRAAQAGARLLSSYAAFYTAEEYQDATEALKIWKMLAAVPAQQVEKVSKVEIQLKKDRAGLLNVPVQVGEDVHDMVFDSGAGLSVLTESYASELGLSYVSDSTVLVKSGITGLATPVRLAVAERLKVGGIAVSHAVFLVFPDSALSFGGGVYKIKGIIGFPIISSFGTLTFTGQTKLTVHKGTAKGRVKPNMIIDGLKPVIYLTYKGVELPYTFDTGGSKTKLSNNFYERFKPTVEEKGTAQALEAEGTGGRVSLKGYEMPELTFFLSGKPIRLEKVFVSQEPISTNGDIYFGNIGQDFIRQFESMTISFEGAYVTFE